MCFYVLQGSIANIFLKINLLLSSRVVTDNTCNFQCDAFHCTLEKSLQCSLHYFLFLNSEEISAFVVTAFHFLSPFQYFSITASEDIDWRHLSSRGGDSLKSHYLKQNW